MTYTTILLIAIAVVLDAADRRATPEKAADPPVASAVSEAPVPFTATAYSTKGNTVKGIQTQPGVVAADSKILPLGSTIRVTEAGPYSGMYVVTDLGTAIVGRRIDIYMADIKDARAFGKKQVKVQLIKRGDNVKFQPETSHEIPKRALAPAQKKDAAAIPSATVPASKPAVEQGRAVRAQEKIEEAKKQ